MTNPNIRVTADVSSVEEELQKIEAAGEKIQKTLASGEVGIDAKQAKADLAELKQGADNLSKALAELQGRGDALGAVDLDRVIGALSSAKQSATDLDKVLEAVGHSTGFDDSVRNAQSIAESLQQSAKAQKVLSEEGIKLSRQQVENAKREFDIWRRSGARGTGRIKDKEFGDWLAGGWREFSIDEGEARRHRSRVLESVGIRTPGGEDGGEGGKWGGFAANAMGGIGGLIGGGIGSMAQGGSVGVYGGMGNITGTLAGGVAGTMIGGPFGAVIGAALGSLASGIIGGVGSAIDAGIERAISEGIDLTDLRHSLGSTTIDFERLRDSLHRSTDGLGVNYNEAVKLARTFSHAATIVDAQKVGQETATATGFARGLGLDPAQAAQFFGMMRHYGLTQNNTDSRRFALMIGEAVNRGGIAPRADELLSAVQNFVQTASRQSLSRANGEAFAGYISSLTGLGIPGLQGDPMAAAALMGRVDASMRQGGAFGEASKNFSLAAYQKVFGPDFTGLDAKLINEQGAYNDLGGAFQNAISLAKTPADKARLRDLAKKGRGKTALQLNMQMLENEYGNLPTEEFMTAGANHFGVGMNEFSAVYKAYKRGGGLGSVYKKLKAAGVDMNNLDTRQVFELSSLASGGDDAIRAQAQKLLDLKGQNAISENARVDLSNALTEGKDPAALRKMVLQLTAGHYTGSDAGAEMRQQQADLLRVTQDFAGAMIPLTMTMKDGIISLAEALAPKSEFTQRYRQEKQFIDTNVKDMDAIEAFLRSGDEDASPEKKKAAREALVAQENQHLLKDSANADSPYYKFHDYTMMRALQKPGSESDPEVRKQLIERYNAMAEKLGNRTYTVVTPPAPPQKLGNDGYPMAGSEVRPPLPTDKYQPDSPMGSPPSPPAKKDKPEAKMPSDSKPVNIAPVDRSNPDGGDRSIPEKQLRPEQSAKTQGSDNRLALDITLYDRSGNVIGDAVVQTRNGAPVPMGVA